MGTPWGEQVKKLRQSLGGLSQEGLAAHLRERGYRVTSHTISQWELGNTSPHAQNQTAILRLLSGTTPHMEAADPKAIDKVRILYAVTQGRGDYWAMLEECLEKIEQRLQSVGGRKHA